MYYKKRDKIISIRVSSELLQKAQQIINNYTTTYHTRDNRKSYYTTLPNKCNFVLLFTRVFCNTIPAQDLYYITPAG